MNDTSRRRNYNTALHEYYKVLKIRERAGTLPANFNASMDKFLRELNALIGEQKEKEFRRAA